MTPTGRNITPPEIARRYRVSTAKVIAWIRAGELPALDLARRGCTRPRYSVTPEALAQFEQARRVVSEAPAVRKLRRRAPAGVKEFM